MIAKRFFSAALLTLAMIGLIGLIGCGDRPGGKGDKSGGGTKSGAGGRVRVAFVTNNPENFWKIAEKGCEKASKDLDVDVEFKRPSPGNAEVQRRIIEDLLSTKIQGIAVSPNDAENTVGFYKKEVNPKVPLIMQDSDVPDPTARRAYLGTHNYRAGRAIGEMIVKEVPKGARIAIFVGKLDVQNAVERRQGVLDVLLGKRMQNDEVDEKLVTPRDAANLKVGDYVLVATKTDGANEAECQRRCEELILAEGRKIDCFVGLWAYNPPAILRAIQSTKLDTKPFIYGFDEEYATLDAIKAGTIKLTVVQDPFEFGYQSVKILAGIAKGDDSALTKHPLVDSKMRIYIPHRVIDRTNVDEFYAKLKSMRGD